MFSSIVPASRVKVKTRPSRSAVLLDGRGLRSCGGGALLEASALQARRFGSLVGLGHLERNLLRFEVELRCLGLLAGRQLGVDVVRRTGGQLTLQLGGHFSLEGDGAVVEPAVGFAGNQHVERKQREECDVAECDQGGIQFCAHGRSPNS